MDRPALPGRERDGRERGFSDTDLAQLRTDYLDSDLRVSDLLRRWGLRRAEFDALRKAHGWPARTERRRSGPERLLSRFYRVLDLQLEAIERQCLPTRPADGSPPEKLTVEDKTMTATLTLARAAQQVQALEAATAKAAREAAAARAAQPMPPDGTKREAGADAGGPVRPRRSRAEIIADLERRMDQLAAARGPAEHPGAPGDGDAGLSGR